MDFPLFYANISNPVRWIRLKNDWPKDTQCGPRNISSVNEVLFILQTDWHYLQSICDQDLSRYWIKVLSTCPCGFKKLYWLQICSPLLIPVLLPLLPLVQFTDITPQKSLVECPHHEHFMRIKARTLFEQKVTRNDLDGSVIQDWLWGKGNTGEIRNCQGVFASRFGRSEENTLYKLKMKCRGWLNNSTDGFSHPPIFTFQISQTGSQLSLIPQNIIP